MIVVKPFHSGLSSFFICIQWGDHRQRRQSTFWILPTSALLTLRNNQKSGFSVGSELRNPYEPSVVVEAYFHQMDAGFPPVLSVEPQVTLQFDDFRQKFNQSPDFFLFES